MARLIVPRTVTVVDGETSRSAPLAEFRSARAYVLLGDPGGGKTEAFRAECTGHDDGEFITARRFLRKGVDRLSEWVGKTLFIDGLDEVRAGSSDPRRQLDQVLERLERLGRPTFRLSCRAADWLGRNDLREIASGAGYEELACSSSNRSPATTSHTSLPTLDSRTHVPSWPKPVTGVWARCSATRTRSVCSSSWRWVASGPKTDGVQWFSLAESWPGNRTTSTGPRTVTRHPCPPAGSFRQQGTCRRFPSCPAGLSFLWTHPTIPSTCTLRTFPMATSPP